MSKYIQARNNKTVIAFLGKPKWSSLKAGDTLWDDSQVAGHGQDVCHRGPQAALQLVEWKIIKTKKHWTNPPFSYFCTEH